MNHSMSEFEFIKPPWLVMFLMLFLFAMIIPFDFNWPYTQQELKGGVSGAISRIEGGNMERRFGLVSLAGFSLLLLSRCKNRFQVNEPSAWFLLVYLVLVLFSLTWTLDTSFSLRRIATVYLLWFSALVFASRYSFKQLASIATFICGMTAAIAFVNELRLGTFNPVDEWWRFSGLFHTVSMGWNCGLLAIAATYLAANEKRKPLFYFFCFIVVAALIFLLLTKSRMAVTGTFLSMGLFLFRIVSGRNQLFLVLAGIILICISYLALGDTLLYYGEEASTLGRGEAAKEQVNDLTGRLPLWIECFRWVEKKPVLGYGFNAFVSPKNIDTIARNVGWVPSSIHSGYIEVLVGLGLVGAVALIGFFLLALKRAYELSENSLAHMFVVSVLVWQYFNLFLEAGLISRPTFMTFFCMIILTRVAFILEEDWEPY